MRPTAIFVCVLCLAELAAADVVHLDGGGRIEGRVTRLGSHVLIEGLLGSVRVPASDILRVEEKPSPLDVYEAKRDAIEEPDAGAHVRLGLWLESVGAGSRARREYLAALAADPDHGPARRRLGYVRYRGEWLTRDELDLQMRLDAGLVEHEGRWFTPDGLEAWLEALAEKEALEANDEEPAPAEDEPAEPERAETTKVEVHVHIEETRIETRYVWPIGVVGYGRRSGLVIGPGCSPWGIAGRRPLTLSPPSRRLAPYVSTTGRRR